MKTTLKSITVTSIISFILYVFLMLTLFSCRTVDKAKSNEQFALKQDLSQLDQKWSNSITNVETKIKESLILDITEKLKQYKESSSTNENESSVISGKATAEEGKEKTFNVGNTTIKTNGFDISFEINTLKQLNQSYESQIQETNKLLIEERNARISSETNLKQENKELSKRLDVLESEKSTQTKTVSKRGVTFWAIVICAVSFVLFLLYKFGGRIPIVAKIKKLIHP